MVRYSAVTLLAVALLGMVLALGDRAQARQRGLAEGRSEALIVAETAVEPLLTDRPLAAGLSATEQTGLRRLVAGTVRRGTVLRLRLRDVAGQVVFSDDGSGFRERPEEDALAAARGAVEARLTRLNTDANDAGSSGPETVEVYLPLHAGSPTRTVGVLEIYLPYAPISADVSAGLHGLYRDLALGLGALYVVLFFISISISRGLRHQLRVNRQLAEHDPLTDLPNRAVFQSRLATALAAPGERSTVVAIVDLDRFKEINDTLGHGNGDALLTALADRLSAHVERGDTVARLGGDEFGILLHDVARPDAALRAVRELVGRDTEVAGLPLSVESSIGYAVAPQDGSEVDDLLQKADVAMYVAKANHAGVVRYHPALDHYDAASLTLMSQFRHAIDTDALVLHYQPKARLSDGAVTAVEALVRWQHPELGLLPPDRFVPLVEQTDLIDPMTEWVMRRALDDVVALGPDHGDVAVAVNVSARNLSRPAFSQQVLDMLRAAGVSPERLIVEVTETALLVDPPKVAAILAELHEVGVRVSIDDFGAGQTSLGHLSALPVHELKIDRCFIRDLPGNAAHRAIVRSVVHLGHNLSLSVVGEGVDSPEAMAALAEAGCDLAQGFLLARPMPLAELRAWLLQHSALGATGVPS